MTFAGIPFWATVALAVGAAGVLAVLHLLRVRPRELRVITTLFWAHAVERTRARTLLERFRHPRTYALLVLICALLSFAIGQPRRTGEPANRISEVVVLDAGASMTAPDADAGGSRFDAARDVVVAEANRLSMDDHLAVVVANPWPQLVHRFDDPRPLIRKTLAATTPAEVPAARDEAIRLARSLLQGREHARVVLVTDRPIGPDATPKSTNPADLQVVRVGATASNAAILWAMFEPDRENPLRGRLSVRVGYWGEKPLEARLDVQRAGGAPLMNETATLTPGATHDFVTADLLADGDTLEIRLRPDDAVLADNRATIRLPLRTPIRVAIDAAVPSALRTAIGSDPSVRVTAADQEHDIDVRVDSTGRNVTRPSVIVIDRGAAAPAGRPVQATGDSPLVRDLAFEGATCGTGASVAGGTGTKALIVSDGVTLAASSNGPGRPCLYLGSALLAEDATATRRAAFAIFLVRAVRDMAGWDQDPVVLTPDRVLEDPMWATRAGYERVTAVPSFREAADLPGPRPTETNVSLGSPRRSLPALSEILLLAALALFLLEAFLHTRGRIA